LVDKLSNALTRLQSAANAVIDSDLDKLSDDVRPGIKQVNKPSIYWDILLNTVQNLPNLLADFYAPT
jgi:hypothetical protein